MKNIDIYTTSTCPYCSRAKDLLKRKNAEYNEINISSDGALRTTMMERSGGKRSVPQIFIGDTHVGGSDDLYALESKGELDKLLQS